VLVHLLGPERKRATIHNARASFIAGIAHGLERPLLIVAPESYSVPLDYRDLLHSYPTVRNLQLAVNRWLDNLPTAASPVRPPGRTKIEVELPLSFGDYVAEDETTALPDYFVDTAEYGSIIRRGNAIFVGRKGTGKTATMLTATAQLLSDKRNLVVPIKPSGYELEALVDIVRKLPDNATVDYFLEGLWKFALLAEIACAAIREAESKPAGIAEHSDLANLRTLLEAHSIRIDEDFAPRLERIVGEVNDDVGSLPEDIQKRRGILNQRIHAGVLRELRLAIGRALEGRDRVAVLIDNLDKGWQRGADYARLTRVLFGLLVASGKVTAGLSRSDSRVRSVNVTLAVFLRADIFSVVLKHAPEPDKLHTLQVRWGGSKPPCTRYRGPVSRN
jgi:hypothetical protein